MPLTGHAYGPAALIVLIGGAGLAGSDEAPWLARLEIDRRPVCYGTAIDGRWVLTARHCIASDTSTEKMDPLRIAVRFPDSLVGVDEVHIPYARNLGISDLTGTDAALLHLRSPRAQTAPLGEVGSAKQAWAVVTELKTGRASLVTIRAVRNKSIYTKGVTRPGQSGSPLLSEDGAVIGIASWRSGRTGTGGLSAFTPWILYALGCAVYAMRRAQRLDALARDSPQDMFAFYGARDSGRPYGDASDASDPPDKQESCAFINTAVPPPASR